MRHLRCRNFSMPPVKAARRSIVETRQMRETRVGSDFFSATHVQKRVSSERVRMPARSLLPRWKDQRHCFNYRRGFAIVSVPPCLRASVSETLRFAAVVALTGQKILHFSLRGKVSRTKDFRSLLDRASFYSFVNRERVIAACRYLRVPFSRLYQPSYV